MTTDALLAFAAFCVGAIVSMMFISREIDTNILVQCTKHGEVLVRGSLVKCEVMKELKK